MLPLNRKHSFLVTGCRALKSTNAVYKNNISTYMRNMDIFLYLKKKELHFLKKRTLHCALYPWYIFKTQLGLWIEHTSSHVNTREIVNKILVMFACSRQKLIIIIIFCFYLKPKREYIRICNHRAFSTVDGHAERTWRTSLPRTFFFITTPPM